MTTEHWIALMENYELDLTPEEIAEGWHWCSNWDGLLVGPGTEELKTCTCCKPVESVQLYVAMWGPGYPVPPTLVSVPSKDGVPLPGSIADALDGLAEEKAPLEADDTVYLDAKIGEERQ